MTNKEKAIEIFRLLEENHINLYHDIAKKDFEAINVTIPYKQTVIPYLYSVSSVAERIGNNVHSRRCPNNASPAVLLYLSNDGFI